MKCPQCQSDRLAKLPSSTAVRGVERNLAMRSAVRGSSHPIGLALALGSAAAKTMLSKVWECKGCGHQWRQWFD